MAEASIAQTAQDVSEAVRNVHEAKPTALVHCGFGFGIVFLNPALEALGLGPAAVHQHRVPERVDQPGHVEAFLGWTGVDQYDEGNPVGQRFLDQYEASVRPAAASTACRW